MLWSGPDAYLGYGGKIEVDLGNRFAVVANFFAETLIVPLDGSAASLHKPNGLPGASLWNGHPALDPSGRYVAVRIMSPGHPELNSVRIFDLATGSQRTLDTHPQGDSGWRKQGTFFEALACSAWLPDGRLITDGDAGLRVWDLAAGTSRLLRPAGKAPSYPSLSLLVTPDGRRVVRLDMAAQKGEAPSLSVFDIASGVTRTIASHGNALVSLALDPGGTILVTGDMDGVVRVGPLSGEKPHLLYAHTGKVTSVAVSPDGRWIASGSDDGTIRLWPMPDLSKPPLHTLPHDELLAKLKGLTNLRAVRDPTSDTGWKVEIGTFPGWAHVPEWQP